MRTILQRLRNLFSPPVEKRGDATYRVFTQDFDIVVQAAELDSVLGTMSARDRGALDEAWAVFSGAMQGWRTKIHLLALDAAARIRLVASTEDLSKTTVTILVDQSGSMRGQSMLLAAASIDVACDFLVHLGVSVEVLGFTTVGWHGGKSRKRWLRTRRPLLPGRLCDLLHIIYRSADDVRASTGGWGYRPMLRPDLPKENVDGEAIEWAATRLRARQEPNKILIVVSDGAQVDDSTLDANDLEFLDRHLRQVVGELERSEDISIGAIGIGFDVDRYYAFSGTVSTPDDLGEGLVNLLESSLSNTFQSLSIQIH